MGQNCSVWIATVKGRQYVRFRLGDNRQRHLGPVEQARLLVDKLNALGINGPGIPVTPEDIKLAARAREIAAAEAAAIEQMQKGVEALRRATRFSELKNFNDVVRAIGATCRTNNDKVLEHMLRFLVILDMVLERCKEWSCEWFKRHLADFFKDEEYDMLRELYETIKNELEYALERAKKAMESGS